MTLHVARIELPLPSDSLAVLESRLPGQPNSKGFIPDAPGGSVEGRLRDGLAYTLRDSGYQIRLEFKVDPDDDASRAIDILARKGRRLMVIEVKARHPEYGVGQVLVYAERIKDLIRDGYIEDCDPPTPTLAAPTQAWTTTLWRVCGNVGIKPITLGTRT